SAWAGAVVGTYSARYQPSPTRTKHPGRFLSTGGLKTGPASPAAPAQRLEEMDVEAAFSHLPVMVREGGELLLPVPDGLIVDCTVGGGGHAAALLEARSEVRLLGIDRDADAAEAARRRLAPFGARVKVVEGGFEHLADLVGRHGEGDVVMGILMDLGVSSPQLDRPERGFSYRFDAPLDMRMDARQALTEADVVNGYELEQLTQLIAGNGEE